MNAFIKRLLAVSDSEQMKVRVREWYAWQCFCLI
jgi:hypothetical protein